VSDLAPLLISIGAAPAPVAGTGADCGFCGGKLGLHAGPDGACVLCTPVLHLDRPRIDEEARLAWIPEMTQAALASLVRELHLQLWADGDRHADSGAPLHFARQALESRADLATEHLGTDRPSELAQALGLLRPETYANRHRALGGLRILPLGHFFVGTKDVYPEVLASWQAERTEAAETSG
jgi:hypothetical protein